MATQDKYQQAVKENRMISVQEATIRKAVGFTIFGLATLRLYTRVFAFKVWVTTRFAKASGAQPYTVSCMHTGHCRNVWDCTILSVCCGDNFPHHRLLQPVWMFFKVIKPPCFF